MFLSFLAWIIFGLVVGLFARLVTPGADPMGIVATTALGIAGSVVGGLLANMLLGAPEKGLRPAGLLGAIIGGAIVLLLYRNYGETSP